MRSECREYARDGLGDDFVDFLSGLDKISKCVLRWAVSALISACILTVMMRSRWR